MRAACTCTTVHNTVPTIKRKTSFTLNRVQQFDPTHTLVLRAAFAREMKRRFNLLRRDIRISIVDNDCFGLRTRLRALAPADKFQFAFGRSQDKIRGFMGWLEEQEKEFIFSQGRSGIGMFRRPGIGGVVAGEEIWTDLYIQSAYQRGIARGRAELRMAGYDVPMFEGIREEQAVAAAFNQPFHADRVGLLYTRTFSELKGITSAMDQQISRVLAQGMAEGRGPTEVARRLTKIVDGIGRRRAEVMARTEFIRAHHVATINEYRQAGVEGVRVLAEWLTAGDSRVCAACGDMEDESSASPFTLDQIEGMIPLHALCRCCAIPAKVRPAAEKRVAVAPRRARPTRPITPTPSGPVPKTVKKVRDQDDVRRGLIEMQVNPQGIPFTQRAWTQAEAIELDLARVLKENPRLSGFVKGQADFVYLSVVDEKAVFSGGSRKAAGGLYSPSTKSITVAFKGRTLTPRMRLGEWTVGQDSASIFRHEFGHHMQIRLRTTQLDVKWIDVWKGVPEAEWKKKVSWYSATDSGEAFAEAFAAYTSPLYGQGNKRRLPKLIEEFFDKALKGGAV